MSSSKIGIITIGQSPRPDVLPDFIKVLGFLPSIEQRGLLDDMSKEEIASLAPHENEDQTLVTRLRDGTEVKLSEKRVIEMLPQAVEDLENRKVDFIILFCTGEFPAVDSKVPVLYPSIIVGSLVSAIFSPRKDKSSRLCVIAPAREQIPMLALKWEKTGCSLLFESLSPYTSIESEIINCAQRVAQLNCDMIVLDCIGYTEEIRRIFTEVAQKPVILPRALLARITAELIPG